MQIKINKIFGKAKSLPLDLFLEKVLYDKNFGYYQKKNPFGKKGDFITAPNISNIFCEMIVIWLVSFWESLNKPKKINIVELGPGNGDFSEILVKTLKNFPQISKSANIYLYEKSDKLTKFQKKRISSSKVLWIKNFDEIKKGPVIFFGNEFLDALPIKQFKKVNSQIFERHAINVKNKVSFVFKKALKNDINKLKKYQLFKKRGLIEFPEYGFKELNNICSVIRKQNGGALFIDYGYVSENKQNTLQSVYKHKFNDLNKNIGDADITSLVNFDLYRKYFLYKNLFVEKIISQSQFLQKMGILERSKMISHKMDYKRKIDLYSRIQRLISPYMMGETFKVIFAKNKKCKFSLAFK